MKKEYVRKYRLKIYAELTIQQRNKTLHNPFNPKFRFFCPIDFF